MSKVITGLKTLCTSRNEVAELILKNFRRSKISHWVPDSTMLKIIYKVSIGKTLDLKNPVGWNAKLQWLKLHDRRPIYTSMVDKIAVKEYIADMIGQEYIIPTLKVWNSADEIDLDTLPEQFVLKCNHDSHSVIICKDKTKFDFQKAKKILSKGLDTNMYWWGREWPYKYVTPRVFAEQYIEDKKAPTDLKDYKLMCFNGEVKCSFVCSDRFSGNGLKVTFFDRDWNKLPFERSFPSSSAPIPKPDNYDLMLSLAEKLSRDIPFVRVDFYEVNGRVYFGELTFFPGAGFEKITPFEWDVKLGEWLNLNSLSQ